MCASVIDATERDFEPHHRVIGYHSSITVDELVEIAKHHLDAMYKYQTELGNALAAANRQGEENRRQERQRIWGYS